jgi:cytosine/adenosine deaminase-related metal-dependent hydrolase
VDGDPLPNGTVTVRGDRIDAVLPHGQRSADLNLGNTAVLPGLVNAHTHLDLSGLRGLAPPTPDFTAWLRRVIRFRRARSAADVGRDIEAGLAECQRHGTTLLGDISGQGWSWGALEKAAVRAVVYREVLGLPEDRARQAWHDLSAWLLAHPATPTCRPGISPHAPYSTRWCLFSVAPVLGAPVATHLAETHEEMDLLTFQGGPFVPFLKELGVWEPEALVRDLDRALTLLNGTNPVALVHGNFLPWTGYVPDNCSLVYCPRTHAAFGHPPHPFREFLRRGVRVALGTDSLASNPDLDLLAEARYLHECYPDVPGEVLLRMATHSGAAVLGWADETGSLTPGKSADLVVLPLPDVDLSDPYKLVLSYDTAVQAVLFRGAWVYPPCRP